MLLKNRFGLVATCVALLGFSVVAPVSAQEYSQEEIEALEHNLGILCNTSFEDLEDMGIGFNESGRESLDVACDAVVDGLDTSDFSDAEFMEALDFLADTLAAVTYEE